MTGGLIDPDIGGGALHHDPVSVGAGHIEGQPGAVLASGLIY
jgi:hypothetical protein